MSNGHTDQTTQTRLFDDEMINDVRLNVGTPELNNQCARCNTDSDLQIHHIKYVPEITTTLCRSCHKSVHNQPNSKFHPRQKANELFKEQPEDSEAPSDATVTVKRINGNSYFYYNWREDGKIKSEYIAPVSEL